MAAPLRYPLILLAWGAMAAIYLPLLPAAGELVGAARSPAHWRALFADPQLGQALAIRQTLRIQYARIAPDGGIGLAQLRLRGEQEIGHYFGASDSAGVSRDGNEMDVAEGPLGKAEAVAVRR